MYPYRDTMTQFLPAHQIQQNVNIARGVIFSTWRDLQHVAWSSARAHLSLIDGCGPDNTASFQQRMEERVKKKKNNSEERTEWNSGEFLAERKETKLRQLHESINI